MSQTVPVTAKTIALTMNISIRTVKNRVNEINSIAGSKIIISNSNGYYVNRKPAQIFIGAETTVSNLPQTWEERFDYIFRIFYTEHCPSIDVYDLCEELYISLSTLRSDINKINLKFKEYEVQFHIEKSLLCMDASESAIRKLKTHLLYNGLNQPFLDLDIIANEFPLLDVKGLIQATSAILRKYHLLMNEFAFHNFILHLCVSIDRFGNSMFLMSNKAADSCTAIEPATSDIIHYINDSLHVSFSNAEIYSLNLLLKASSNLLYTSPEEAKIYIGKHSLELSMTISDKVKEKYDVDLSGQSFQLPFAMHLKTLLIRASHNYSLINPMLNNIRKNNPYIFDLSVFISLLIAEHENVIISDDEIAYIAIHVGAELQRKQNDTAKIQAILFSSDYMKIAEKNYSVIVKHYQNDLFIKKVVHSLSELDKLETGFDLLITTFAVPDSKDYAIFQISPLISSSELTELDKLCDDIYQQKQCRVLFDNFNHYFSEELFFTDKDITISAMDKYNIITFMATKIVETGNVDEKFVKDVLSREALASTGFDKIAIPHGTEVNADKSSICVLISNNGVKWDDTLVHVVMMFSLNKDDQHIFPLLYDALVQLFQEENVLRLLGTAKDFSSFHKVVFSLLS